MMPTQRGRLTDGSRWRHGALFAAGVSLIAAVSSAQLLALYQPQPAAPPPCLDGDLSDAAWSNAAPAGVYFEYMKPDPGPGILVSELRLLYDRRGLYLAIVNHDAHPERLRARCAGRNNPDIWTDDCAEFYLDPSGRSVGYFYFAVNSRGARYEFRRVDAAVVDNEWRSEGAQFATAVGSDRWTIEGFIPWADIGGTPAPGDIWRFNHVRYAYTSGRFQGVTWAPGGNYQSPRHFGYLLFGEGRELTPPALGARLAGRVPTPWSLLTAEGILSSAAPGDVQHRPGALVLSATRRQTETALQKTAVILAGSADPALARQFAELRAEVAAVPADAPPAQCLPLTRRLDALRLAAGELYWHGRLEALLSGRDASAIDSKETP